MVHSMTPEQFTLVQPKAPSRTALVTPRLRLTRRRMAGWAAMGAAAGLLLPARAFAGTDYEGNVPKESTTDPAGDSVYTGPLYGHVVTWEPDIWLYSSSASADMGYDYDYINLSSVETGGLSQVQHMEVALDDVDQAEEESYELYLSGYGMTTSDAELLEQWTSDDAAGTLFYWLGYDDNPYTYIEYAPTGEDNVWSVTYVQIRGGSWDAGAMTDMLESIWTDDELTIRATGSDDIVDAIDADVN